MHMLNLFMSLSSFYINIVCMSCKTKSPSGIFQIDLIIQSIWLYLNKYSIIILSPNFITFIKLNRLCTRLPTHSHGNNYLAFWLIFMNLYNVIYTIFLFLAVLERGLFVFVFVFIKIVCPNKSHCKSYLVKYLQFQITLGWGNYYLQ